MADSNTPRIDSAKQQKVYERMYAYHLGILHGVRFVEDGHIEELKTKIQEEEAHCQTEANETACWAAKGLKQIQSCQNLQADFKRSADTHRELTAREIARGERIFLSLIETAYRAGQSSIATACQGYVESARLFMGMVLQAK